MEQGQRLNLMAVSHQLGSWCCLLDFILAIIIIYRLLRLIVFQLSYLFASIEWFHSSHGPGSWNSLNVWPNQIISTFTISQVCHALPLKRNHPGRPDHYLRFLMILRTDLAHLVRRILRPHQPIFVLPRWAHHRCRTHLEQVGPPNSLLERLLPSVILPDRLHLPLAKRRRPRLIAFLTRPKYLAKRHSQDRPWCSRHSLRAMALLRSLQVLIQLNWFHWLCHYLQVRHIGYHHLILVLFHRPIPNKLIQVLLFHYSFHLLGFYQMNFQNGPLQSAQMDRSLLQRRR